MKHLRMKKKANADSNTDTVDAVSNALRMRGSPSRALASAWFFKTGKGQYGYGDKFIGVSVPEQRKIAKRFSELSSCEIDKLLKSPIHECRLTALLILVGQFKSLYNEKGRLTLKQVGAVQKKVAFDDRDNGSKMSELEITDSMASRIGSGNMTESSANRKKMKLIADFYLAHTKYINNWDLVDSSASYILGSYLMDKERDILYKLAKSNNLWERRIAIIASGEFIRNGQFSDTLAISKMLLHDEHDLIHKAVGWMLREVGKRSKPTLVAFLDEYSSKMPRTALRYSIEHFDGEERERYMRRVGLRKKECISHTCQ